MVVKKSFAKYSPIEMPDVSTVDCFLFSDSEQASPPANKELSVVLGCIAKYMEIGISEFMFGYAFLHEQTLANWGDLKAAPVLPSLQQEQAQGWDAQLPLNGADFYCQFKLSDYLSRGNATFLRDGTYNSPYYRFWLHRRNRNQQHRRLRQHWTAVFENYSKTGGRRRGAGSRTLEVHYGNRSRSYDRAVGR